MQKTLTILSFVLTMAFMACGQDITKLQESLALKYMVQMPVQPSAHPPVIILLHGYGSDEKDMFELRNVLPKNYLIIAARAPTALPERGYQWFNKEMIGANYNGRTVSIDNSRNLLVTFIGQVVSKYHADASAVYLMGFSQGAIMSYETGLTHPVLLKGIGVMSGVMFPSLKPLIKNTPDLKRLKIFIAHGTADNILTYANGKAASDYLYSLGLNPEFHKYEGMPHSISNEEIADLLRWLK